MTGRLQTRGHVPSCQEFNNDPRPHGCNYIIGGIRSLSDETSLVPSEEEVVPGRTWSMEKFLLPSESSSSDSRSGNTVGLMVRPGEPFSM